MQNIFVKQTVYDLSKIEEAELVIPSEKAYNIDNTEVNNNDSEEQEGS